MLKVEISPLYEESNDSSIYFFCNECLLQYRKEREQMQNEITERISASGKLYRKNKNGRWYRPYSTLSEEEKQKHRESVRRYTATEKGLKASFKKICRYRNRLIAEMQNQNPQK